MIEASQTTVMPAGIWAIVIVMVLLLAFWLSAIAFADRSQARASERARLTGEGAPGLRGAWTGGSVPGEQAPEIPGEAVHEPIETRDEPAQPTAGRPRVPRPRSGDADRAARSYAGQGTPDAEQPGR